MDTVLKQEAIGFMVILALIWITEFAKIPHRFFGEPDRILWFRVLFRTFVVAVIWTWVHITTKRYLRRLHYLEEFLRVCSWCQKVGHEGEWLTMEEYFGSKFNTQTSHGICPECATRATGRPGLIPPLPEK